MMDEKCVDAEAFLRELDELDGDDPTSPHGPRLTGDDAVAAKRQILQRLAELGIAVCEMEYHGEDGLPAFHPCVASDEDDGDVVVPDDLERMMDGFVDRALPEGWADELGGYGTVTFEVGSGVVVFYHRAFEVVESLEWFEV